MFGTCEFEGSLISKNCKILFSCCERIIPYKMPRGLARWENQMNTRKRFGSEVEFLDAEQ
jgi:hypothetical protein